MHWFKKYVESGKLSVIYRILLVVWDAVCINLCSFAALFIRHELKWDLLSAAESQTIIRRAM